MQRDIDQIIQQVTQRIPKVVVTQLKVKYPADDDGLWWFSIPGTEREIQIESSYGACPFLVESHEQSSSEALRASTVAEAVRLIVAYLEAVSEGRTVALVGELH